MIMYRIYTMLFNLNGTFFSEVWIDPHYELKHKDSINDELILELLVQANFDDFRPSGTSENGFLYYESDILYKAKQYRFIFAIPPDNSFIGIRNIYRRSK